MKREYYTYDKEGVVTKHKFLLFAIVRARYRFWVLKEDSYVDMWDGECTRTIKHYVDYKRMVEMINMEDLK